MSIQIPYNYDPYRHQIKLYDARSDGIKRGYAIWHRRAGKDKTFINIMAKESVRRVGTYFYILPYYKQARIIIWEGTDSAGFRFIDHFPSELVRRRDNQQMVLELHNGTFVRLVGSDNIDSIVGTNPVGVIFSEFSLHKPQAWDYIRPILAENNGWAYFNGTPRGRNHAWRLWEAARKDRDWVTQLCTVDDTERPDGSPIITLEDIEAERMSGMPEELIQQEFYCSFEAGLVGSFFIDLLNLVIEEKRRRRVPHEPELPVITGWDLGMDDHTVIWFAQVYRHEIRLIDCYANQGKALPHYVNILNRKPYTYDYHCFPHDLRVRSLNSGRTREQTLRKLGLKNIMVVPRLPHEEGIHAVRQMLPKCYFDDVKTFDGYEALKAYRREYDEKNQTFRNAPVHDGNSHYADGLRTLALGMRRYKNEFERDIPKNFTHALGLEDNPLNRPVYRPGRLPSHALGSL